MGTIAPRAAWANIVVNGESYGLYGMVEEVDGRFADNRWPGNGSGNLYKEAWPTNPEEGWTHNHNYYFYQEETRDRFWSVPWDLHGTSWIQDCKSNVPRWTETPADCSIVYSLFNGDASAKAPGCNPIFRAIAADMTQINELVDELLVGPFATETMLAKIDACAAFISDSVAADPKLDQKTKVTNFESSVADMKRTVPLLADRLRAIAERTPVSPIVVPMTGVADFETHATLDAEVSVVASVNAASSPIQPIRRRHSRRCCRLLFKCGYSSIALVATQRDKSVRLWSAHHAPTLATSSSTTCSSFSEWCLVVVTSRTYGSCVDKPHQ